MSRAYGYGAIKSQLNTLQSLVLTSGGTPTLQQVLDAGDTAQGILTINNPPSTITNEMRFDTQIISDAASNTATHQTDGFLVTNQPFGADYGQLLKDRLKFQVGATLTEIINNGTELDINGQVDFNNAPHAPDPVNGNDLANKGYVDSLVGQYSGGYNFFFNYSVVDGLYRSLGQSVVAAAQQIVPITTDTTNQLVAEFVSSALGITSIPSGIWNVLVFSEVAAIGGVLTYFFEVYKLTGAVETLIFTSGTSTDVNATTTPTAFGINGTLTAPYTLLLTDKIVIKIYLHKDGAPLLVNTYFQNAYYSFVQSTLNAGTTLLSSNNTFTGTNAFTLGLTAPSLDTATAVALNIGTTNATPINIGKVGVITTIAGGIQTPSLDTATATTLSIGTTNATPITIGKAGVTTSVIGTFQAGNIDRSTAGTLNIGATNATAISFNSKALSNITNGVNSYTSVSTNTILPSVQQLGYYLESIVSTATTSGVAGTITNLATYTLVPAGVWLFRTSFNINQSGVNQSTFSLSTTSATENLWNVGGFATPALNGNYAQITGVITITAATSSVFFTGSSTTASVSITNIRTSRLRIA